MAMLTEVKARRGEERLDLRARSVEWEGKRGEGRGGSSHSGSCSNIDLLLTRGVTLERKFFVVVFIHLK